MTQDQIAEQMGMDAKTLRMYFSRELDAGALFLEAQALQVLLAKMYAGNVTAAKAVHQIAGARAGYKAKAARPKTEAPLGKKELLRAAAGQPPASWTDLLN
jgi:hypothetical protein